MNKFFLFIFIFFLFSSKSFSQILTLNKCYMIKWDGDVIYNDKIWSQDHWNEMNIVNEKITSFYQAKEFLPKNMSHQQFIDITLSCTNTGGCTKKATDFLNKYNLYKTYIRNDDYKVSINYDTGTIIDEDVLTDEAVKIINNFRKLDFKWRNKLSNLGTERKLYLVEKNKYENYKIINYTDDTIFSQSTKYRFLNVNIKNNTLYYKIDSENYNETASFICRSKNSPVSSNSTLKKLLKKLY